MTQDDDNNTDGAYLIPDKIEEFIYPYLNTTSALYWQINVIENKLRRINDYRIPGLGNKSSQILQNMHYSRTVILEKDFPRFESFMKEVKKRKAASVLIRIKADDGTMRWLKVAGWPDPCKSTCCFGFISDETQLVSDFFASSRDESSIQQKVQLFDTPVFAANFSDRKILAVNQALLSAFGIEEPEALALDLNEVLNSNTMPYIQSIYESLIFDQRWDGNIALTWRNEAPFSAKASIRAVSDLGHNMLWFSLHNVTAQPHELLETPPAAAMASDPTPANRMSAIGEATDIDEMLSLILENQPHPPLADALIYSDVDVASNRVSVYGKGVGLAALAPGFSHPYEGSIAENILNFRLDHLILTETTESIKPIDWALFIPMGIHSYFAMPFYEEGILTTVLIFCSSQPGTFTEENVHAYTPLYPAFLKGLARWNTQK
ncbi:hypothetical protein [Desulfoluna sp.]|uniref:hypothetical protein n=1 Tax=Desulfoluna sp. TaxID=2045199 RepID=UPI002604046C|nr:hypothetical protein [Desulfoluna sp.]